MCLKELLILLGYCALVCTANAQKTTGAFKIFEDLPLDMPGKASALKPHETVAEKIRRHIFIKTELSKNNCFIGEPLQLTYKLYSALQNRSEINKRQTFTGFTVQRIGFSNDDDKHQEVNGKDYRVFTIDKNIIIPYQTGKLQLEQMEVHNTVFYEDEKKGKQQYEGIVKSDAQLISVSPLPPLKKEEMFSGAVGSFLLVVETEKAVLTINEKNRITIELSGKGNLSNVSLPAIRWPGSFEIFEGSDKLLDSLDEGFHTKKIFAVTMVAKQAGRYTIEPVCITVFDPKKKSYEKICSQPLELNIQQGIEKTKAAVAVPVTATAKNSTAGYWIPIALVLLGIGFALIAWRNRRNAGLIKQKAALEMVIEEPVMVTPDYAEKAKALLTLQEPADFMQSFKDLLKQYMADKTKMEFNRPYEMLVEALAAQDAAKAGTISALVEKCDYLLYAPGTVTPNMRNSLVQQFVEILNG